MKRTLTACVASLCMAGANALTVTETNDPLTLVSALLAGSSGITVDGASIGLVGVATQSGTYSGFSFAGNATAAAPALSLGNGIVMTSGDATVPVTNTTDSYSGLTGTGASPTISAITSLDSFDQNRLTFSFSAAVGSKSVSASFIFASEEFPEFAASQFADGFAFVVDGVNYAKFQDGSPVSLLSITSNANLFSNELLPVPYGIEYDGLTPSLTVTGLLDPTRTTHTLEIVIADTGDDIYDSAVFISGLKAGVADGGGITPTIPEPGTWALMLAGLAAVAGVSRRRGGMRRG
jgi:hypothetical protein